MCSIASNEKFVRDYKIAVLFILLIRLSLLRSFNEVSTFSLYGERSAKLTLKLFFINLEVAYFYLFCYLLITLFVAVTLRKKKEGAVRMKAIYETTKNPSSP